MKSRLKPCHSLFFLFQNAYDIFYLPVKFFFKVYATQAGEPAHYVGVFVQVYATYSDILIKTF